MTDGGMTREAIFGEIRYRAFVYGRRTAMMTKLNIPLRGIALDDMLAVDENPARRIELSDTPNAKLARAI